LAASILSIALVETTNAQTEPYLQVFENAGISIVEVIPLKPHPGNDVSLEMELWKLSDGRQAVHGRIEPKDDQMGRLDLTYDVDLARHEFSARRIDSSTNRPERPASKGSETTSQLGHGGFRCYEAFIAVEGNAGRTIIARALSDVIWRYELETRCLTLERSVPSCRVYNGTGFVLKACVFGGIATDQRVISNTSGLWQKPVPPAAPFNITIFTEVDVFRTTPSYDFVVLGNADNIHKGAVTAARTRVNPCAS